MKITFYDSLEEMFEAEEKARIAADGRTRDWQKKLDIGDHFIMDSGYDFPIFGKVLRKYEEDILKNYRFCDCYSVACPEGEKGDIHVSSVLGAITEDMFSYYKAKDWII